MSLATLGAALGSIIGGPFADKVGRKPTIIMADLFFTFGAIIMAVTQSIGVLMIGRLLIGVIE